MDMNITKFVQLCPLDLGDERRLYALDALGQVWLAMWKNGEISKWKRVPAERVTEVT